MIRFFLTICVLLLPSIGLAADPTHQVLPRAIDRTVTASDVLNEHVTIINQRPHTIKVYATVNGLVVNEQGDILDYVPNVNADRSNTITSWIQIQRGVITLEAGASTTLPVSIKIPAEAEAGEYHALIGFGEGRNREIAEQTVISGAAPGTLVRIEIPEEIVPQSDLDLFSVDRFILDKTKEAVTYTVFNTTDTPLAPSGEVIVYNNRGAEIGTVPINPAGVLVPSGETLAFTAPIDALQVTGRYQAKLALNNDSLAAAVYDATNFFYIPWWQLLVLFILLILMSIGLYRVAARGNRSVTVAETEVGALPLHVYEGQSPEEDHDINLKQ